MSDILSNSLSNYGLYIKERLNMDIIEDDRGFVTYEIISNVLWIRDMFVRKECRQHGAAKEWMESLIKIANLAGCKQINTHVCIKSIGWELSFKLLVDFGYKVVGQVNSLIYLMYTI